MPPTDTPPAPDPRRPDTSAFLEQQAAILLDVLDNDTMVRRFSPLRYGGSARWNSSWRRPPRPGGPAHSPRSGPPS